MKRLGTRVLLAGSLACATLLPAATAQCKDWSPDFAIPGQGLDDAVLDLVVFDDGTGPAIYATGAFTQAGGVPVGYIAKWDGAQWWPLGSGLDDAGTVLAVHTEGGGPPSLYVGGWFTEAGGQPAEHVARWDGTSWHAVGGGVDYGQVNALCSHDDGTGRKLFVGGGFLNAGGSQALRIAAWDGQAWAQVGDGFDGPVSSLEVYDEGAGEVLIAGGGMHSSGTTQVRGIARWSGGTWSEVGGGVSGGVASMTVYDLGLGSGSQLWIGGNFNYAGGVAHPQVAAWDGAVWSGPPTGPGVQVNGIVGFHDGTLPSIVILGPFGSVGSLPANSIAAWNGSSWFALGTGLWPAFGFWSHQALLPVVEPAGPRLYVGGDFDTAGGKESLNLARWNEPCTGPVLTQQPEDQTALFPEPVTFQVKAHGTAPVQYQWRHDGVPISDISGEIEGEDTDTLTIFVWSYSDHGLYDCVVTNPFGTVTSQKALLTVPAGGLSGSPVEVTVVLYPPEPTANVPGSEFTDFFECLQTPTDEVLFHGELDGGQRCLARWDSGPSEVLLKTGDPAPGLPTGFTLGALNSGSESIDTFVVGPNGTTAFDSLIAGPGVTGWDDQGIWHHDGTVTHLVVREGDQAVGMPAGTQFRFTSFTHPQMSDNGRVVFQAPGYQQGSYYQSGVWMWDVGGGTALVAETGAPAPGTGASFTSFMSTLPILTPGGEVAFYAHLDSTTGWTYSSYTDASLWYGSPGSLQLAVKSGDPAPGFPAGTNIEQLTGLGGPKVYGNAKMVTGSYVAGPAGYRKRALYQWEQGTLTPIAMEDQQAPGADPGSTFFSLIPYAVAEPDRVVFYSNLATSCPQGCATAGLWISSGGTIVPVALDRGEPLPDLPDGYIVSSFDTAAVNELGQVAFSCTVGPAGVGYWAVFGWSTDQGLYPIAVPGTQIEIAPGEYRTVRDAQLWPITAGFPDSPNLSPSGLITLWLKFTDGSNAIAQGSMTLFESLHFGSGIPYCFGDGTGTPCPCGNPGQEGAGCRNSSGVGAVLAATGSVEVSDDELAFRITGLPPKSIALLYQGTAQAGGGPGVPFGDGLRCAGGMTRRLGARVANAYGVADFGPGLSGLGKWVGGETWNFQAWYRDPKGPCGLGYNLSNGYRVVFLP